MPKFQFDGEWDSSTITLGIFSSELDNPKYAFRRSELEDAKYALQIFDVYADSPDLSTRQSRMLSYA